MAGSQGSGLGSLPEARWLSGRARHGPRAKDLYGDRRAGRSWRARFYLREANMKAKRSRPKGCLKKGVKGSQHENHHCGVSPRTKQTQRLFFFGGWLEIDRSQLEPVLPSIVPGFLKAFQSQRKLSKNFFGTGTS